MNTLLENATHMEARFLEFANACARRFHEITDSYGNAVISFRRGGYAFVKEQDVKEKLDPDSFIPLRLEGEIGCHNDQDFAGYTAPALHVKLYESLPHINYIIQSKRYRNDTPYVMPLSHSDNKELPDRVLNILEQDYGTLEGEGYALNIAGHGSILMGGSAEQFDHASHYYCGYAH